MSLADIREQIRVILAGVSGIGVGHDYDRWAVDWGKFLNLFREESTGKINGYMISRKKRITRAVGLNNDNFRTHHIVLRFIMGLKDEDASEIVFQKLIDDVCDALEAKDTLNGTCFTISDVGTGDTPDGIAGPQADVIDNRIFGSVLCHYAEINIYPQEDIST